MLSSGHTRTSLGIKFKKDYVRTERTVEIWFQLLLRFHGDDLRVMATDDAMLQNTHSNRVTLEIGSLFWTVIRIFLCYLSNLYY